jgi:hypothetical protein
MVRPFSMLEEKNLQGGMEYMVRNKISRKLDMNLINSILNTLVVAGVMRSLVAGFA